MERQHLQYLLHQYTQRKASPAEIAELNELDLNIEANKTLLSEMLVEGFTTHSGTGYDTTLFDDLDKRALHIDTKLKEVPFDLHIEPVHRIHFFRKWGWAAASVLLLMCIGTYLWVTHINNKETSVIVLTASDTAPGSDGAILTLADGKQVVLDSLNNGVIASQNGSDVILHNGLLAYDLTDKLTKGVEYNTITTPNGRQFAATLPDGTRVWLNAASSIRYPTVFTKHERAVEVTGEVYMEVMADKSKPFLVRVNDLEVQVLGTSFNINAYHDEPNIKTTLLDGSIKVMEKEQPHSGVILQPGQQVVYNENITVNKAVDIEQVVAWKNGVFNLNGATLEAFMRQIARWYDLKVVYKGAVPYEIFKGKMGRDLQLSQILQVLSLYNIQYKLSEKTITIEPQ